MSDSVDRSSSSVPAWFARALVAAAGLLFLVARVIPSALELSHGYAAYYTSAWLLLDGADPVQFYQHRWFMEWTIALGFGASPDIFNINPPATALILLPLAGLSPERADFVWTIANGGIVVLVIVLLARVLRDAGLELSWRAPLPWLLAAFTLVYNPVWETVKYGQVYIALLLLTVLALGGYVRNQEGRFGGLLGLLLFFKSSGTLLWVLPVVERRFRALAAGVGTILAGIVVSAPVLGFRVWWEYPQWLPGLFNQPWTGVTAYQTVTSFVHHNLKASDRYNEQPLFELPWLASPLAIGSAVVITAAAIASGWFLAGQLPDTRARLCRFGLIAALAVPLQPVGEEYHYALVLPSVWIVLALAATGAPGIRSSLSSMLGLTGAVMIALPVETTHPWFEPGVRALFAYPKLYGALLVAGSLAVVLVDEPANWPVRAREFRAGLARDWGVVWTAVARSRGHLVLPRKR